MGGHIRPRQSHWKRTNSRTPGVWNAAQGLPWKTAHGMGLRAPPSGQGAVHCHGPYGNTRCEALLAKAQTSTRRGEPEHCTSGRAEFQASCATEALRRPCEEEDEGGGTEGREGRREDEERAGRRGVRTPPDSKRAAEGKK
ncbi:unnamed protein product [Prorocentrum cordatum]|uniref:Uncharacterized protein n=2 Tax=Prorocentrum cordatum TaxID=2364126 RepID=A0ABN9TSM2_9DINO|nr:unnamed protein product [Polarella glacialis]